LTQPKGRYEHLSVTPICSGADDGLDGPALPFLHRQLTREALLYTEMVVADGIIHGDRERLLGL
jgi:hypothetical protein